MTRMNSPMLLTGLATLLTGFTVFVGAARLSAEPKSELKGEAKPGGEYVSMATDPKTEHNFEINTDFNPEILLSSTLLTGAVVPVPQAAPDAPDKNPITVRDLHAGPIHVKFQDGELRYISVGEKEIARRLYFAVRDGNWNTAMPKFTRMDIHDQGDHFTIDLEAQCQSSAADYHWTGTIVGKSNGTITFTASGEPNMDFQSNRIGLCLLLGTPSLAGQKFETTGMAGVANANEFPHLVSPKLVAEKFQTLHYKIDHSNSIGNSTYKPVYNYNGMEMKAVLQGATFDMEDQRNWGDSSYKAYAPLPYAYPSVMKGDTKQETITLSVQHAPLIRPTISDFVTVRVGKPLTHAHIPKIGIAAEGMSENNFDGLNMDRTKQQGDPGRAWGINPSVHLPDEDNFIENLPTIVDQAATVRSFAPNMPLHIAPLRIRKLFDDGHRDARNGSAFGAAWCAAVIKYLALAGVASADFDMGPGDALNLQQKLAGYAGKPLLDTHVDSYGQHTYVEAFAIEESGKPLLWLINLSAKNQAVSYGKTTLTLSPYEVREIRSTAK